MISPSACSVDVAAEPRELGRQRGEPVGLVAAEVRDAAQVRRARRPAAQSAASAGVSSPTSCRSSVDPAAACPLAGDGEPGVRERDRGAHRARGCRAATSPAWVVERGQSRTVTRAAGRRRPAPGTARRWTGRARSVVDGAAIGPARPATDCGSASSTSTPWRAQHRDGHVDVRQRRARGWPSWRTSTPSVEARAPASSSAETNWLERRASIDDLAAAHVPGAVHRERQARSPSIADAERAQRVEHRRRSAGVRMLRVAVEGDGAVGQGGDRRHEAHDGAGQAAVDRDAAGAAGRGHEPVVRRRCRSRRPERARAPAISWVSRERSARRTTAGAVGERGQHEGAVGQRLGAGQRQLGVHGSAGEGGTPRSAGHRRSVASGARSTGQLRWALATLASLLA